MPFQYSQYRSPLTDSIAARIANQGAIEANRAQQTGNAWAGAVQNIGQAVAAIPGQMEAQKRAGIQDQLLAGQVADMNQARQGQAAVDSMMRGDQLPAGDVGPRQQSYLDANGLFDIQKMTQEIGKSGLGHMAPELLKGAEAINDSILKHQQLEQQANQQHAIMLGDAAAGALKLADAGTPIPQAMDFVVQPFLATKRFSPDEYAQVKAQVASLPPEQQRAALTALMDQAAKLDKGETLAKDSERLDRYGRVVATNVAPPKPKYQSKTALLNGQPTELSFDETTGKYFNNGQDVTGQVAPYQGPKSLQSKSVMVDGKPVEAVFDPAKGTLTVNGEDVTAKARPIPPAAVTINNANRAGAPGDYTKTGDEFLQTVPAQWRQTVKKIANYDEDPTKVASMRGGMREQLMQWVNQVNPAYDASQFSNRAPTRKAYTTGTQGQQINALNTAIGHLDQLIPIAEKLNNGSFVPGNEVMNKLSSMFGSEQVTNFETLKDALAGEVASVLSKGAATVSGIQAEKEKIKAASSPQQLAGYVKTLIPVMGSKLAALDYQYHQAMGSDDAFSALSPSSKETLAKYGFDPAAHAGGAGGGAMVSVTAPNGKTYQFKTQADADAFKAKAGIK